MMTNIGRPFLTFFRVCSALSRNVSVGSDRCFIGRARPPSFFWRDVGPAIFVDEVALFARQKRMFLASVRDVQSSHETGESQTTCQQT